jgi:transposase
MASMPAPAAPVTVGVDTHLDLQVAAVVDQTGRLLGTKEFAASTRGEVALATWAERFGAVERVGVACTGTYGAGSVLLLAPLAALVAAAFAGEPCSRAGRRPSWAARLSSRSSSRCSCWARCSAS